MKKIKNKLKKVFIILDMKPRISIALLMIFLILQILMRITLKNIKINIVSKEFMTKYQLK